MQFGRVIGVDFGTKKIGIAIADPLRIFSQPVGTYPQEEALKVIERINRDEGLATIVIGWPFEEDGKEGKATQRVQEFINRMKKLWPDADFVKQDERYSSEKAKELIKASERPSMKSGGRGRIDTAAAGLILQDHLDESSF